MAYEGTKLVIAPVAGLRCKPVGDGPDPCRRCFYAAWERADEIHSVVVESDQVVRRYRPSALRCWTCYSVFTTGTRLNRGCCGVAYFSALRAFLTVCDSIHAVSHDS